MGNVNCFCPQVKSCLNRTHTINPDLLIANSKEIENLDKSRIEVPFRIETPLNHSIISCNSSKNLEDILPDDSLESIQYYSRFENNNHSEISSIKSSKKDSKYLPTLFKMSSFKKEEIYLPDNCNNFNFNENDNHNENNISVDVEILEEEKSIENISFSSMLENKNNVRKLRSNSFKIQQDL
jgi:hypothetical protein